MKKKKIVVDLFCGAGGESQGIHDAFTRQGQDIRLFAVNHWEVACATHALNFPSDECICQDIQTVIPTNLVKQNEEVELFWASPECTHFSTARGGKPMDDQSRCTPFDIIRWLTMLRVKRVIIENVPEFETWGPLGEDARPIKDHRGQFFQMFVSSLRAMDYIVDWRVLNAADYGAPTTRTRLFLQAVHKDSGKTISWPAPTHCREPEADMFSACEKWRSARSIIDWSIPCQAIDDRKKPLASNTMQRILNGIKKYWGEQAMPFLVRYNGGSNRFHSISDPVPTLDTSNRYGLVQPLITSIGQTSSKNRSRTVDEPLSTVVTKQEHCLIEPMLIPQQSCGILRPVDKPVPTIATAGAISIVEPLLMEYYGNGNCIPVSNPVGTITTKDRFALLTPENCRIGFRMLTPQELQLAQSFPETYRFTGTKTDVVKQIGNAVCPKIAEALAYV